MQLNPLPHDPDYLPFPTQCRISDTLKTYSGGKHCEKWRNRL